MKLISPNCYLIDSENNTVYNATTSEFGSFYGIKSSYDGVIDIVKKTIDLEAQKIINTKGLPSGLEFSNDVGIIQNYFHWFTISLTNYLRLIFFVQYIQNNNWTISELKKNENKRSIKKFIDNKLNETIPLIYKWRNKVGAHYSLTDPRKDDSLATLINSTSPVNYKSPFFYTNLFSFHNKETEGQEVNIPQWSITVEFNKLKARFFSGAKIKSFNEILKDKFDSIPKDDVVKIKKFFLKAMYPNKLNHKVDVIKSQELYKVALEQGKKGYLIESENIFKESILHNNKNIDAWDGLVTILARSEKYHTAKLLLLNLESKKLINHSLGVKYIQIIGMKFNEIDNALKTFEGLSPEWKEKEKSLLTYLQSIKCPEKTY